MPRHARKKPTKKKKTKGRWMKHVMSVYRKNKAGGLKAAMRRAKKSYKK